MKCKKCGKELISSEVKVLENICWNCHLNKRCWNGLE
jgi:hypothetical protein